MIWLQMVQPLDTPSVDTAGCKLSPYSKAGLGSSAAARHRRHLCAAEQRSLFYDPVMCLSP